MRGKLLLLVCMLALGSAALSKPGGFDLIDIPDSDDPDAGNWFVDGFVGGKPYRFYLDTGAALTSLVHDSFTASFAPVGSRQSAGAFAKHRGDLIIVPEIRVGPLVRKAVTVARAPAEAVGTSNLLGMDAFKELACHFLFEESRVEILADAPSLANSNDLVLGERFHPYVRLHWGAEVEAEGVWDTGAGMTCVDLAFIARHPHLFTPSGTSVGRDSSGTEAETPVYLMQPFELGGHRFPATRVVGIDLAVPNSTILRPMDFILGYNVLRKANWIFDFPKRRWTISKMLP